jgi:hypothetical protein
VYKLVEGNRCNKKQITTLRKPDGSLTEGMGETLKFMMEHFTKENKEAGDTHQHAQVRAQAQEPAEADEIKNSPLKKPGM